MAEELTTPLLPCGSLDAILDFYRCLGFEVTYEQTTPYVYGAVQRGGVQLHFHRPKAGDAKKLSGTCLVFVAEVEPYHRAFADALRAKHGAVPTAGLPRITRLRKGQARFTVLDPAGNRVVYIQRDEPDPDYGVYAAARSRLALAIETAALMRDMYVNDQAAASVLDKALARAERADPIDRARALAARAELAVAMGEAERARSIRDELRQVPLSAEERKRYRHELGAADEVERWRTAAPRGRRGRRNEARQT